MARSRPLIGITCYEEEEAVWGKWRRPAALLPASYVHAVQSAGGIPLLLPPQSLEPREVVGLLGRLDGLIIAGGDDLEPSLYGEAPHPRSVLSGRERDGLELAAVVAASESGLPLLGICRGVQVLNVARGGSLIQHLPDVVGHGDHSPVEGGYGNHDVRIEDGTRLSDLLSWQKGPVPTHHHQGIGRIGEGLRPSAFAADGVVEALEDEALPFLIGVQWHPEAGEDPALFGGLIEAARERSRRDGGL